MKKYTSIINVIISSVLISGCGSGFESGEGKKIGQIVKIGKHGMFCSTYEAELIRGGFSGGSGVNGQALNFSIKSGKLYKDLVSAMENQQEIELHYSKREFSGPCFSETGTIAIGFRVLNSENKKDEEPKLENIKEKVEEINMGDELVTQ